MSVHHVKNADLRNEIIKSKEQDELTKEALDMLILMSKKFSLKLYYVYPEDREDCIASSIMDCYKYWRGYDPAKSQNAFAYFTQIVKMGAAKQFKRIYGQCPKSKRISISDNNIYTI
jgi:hypothetical protein